MEYIYLEKMKLSFIILLVGLGCQNTNCDNIGSFSSYSEAMSKVRSARFNLKDITITPHSSWIAGAEYYSCDQHNGYFILNTQSADYIFSNVPAAVWYDFKKAESAGKYYQDNIKGRYQLVLRR